MSGSRRAVVFLTVLAFLALVACLVVPFSTVPKRAFVPPDRYLDATLAAFIVTDSVEKLVADPRHFYDTAILHPDRTQLRSTEPFLGFALLALPIRSVLHLDDADLFEMLRWVLVFTSLLYAYLLFRAAGVDIPTSAAGAAACACQPGLLIGISRLQILSIPLLLAVLYHALMVWRARPPRAGHSIALFLWLMLYPLCGAINATAGVVAGVLLLPLCLKVVVELWRQRRLPALALPVAAAVLVDLIALAPWLMDRGDMRVYTSEAFLAVKRWTPTFVPLRAAQLPPFIASPAGLSVAVSLTLMGALLVMRRAAAAVRWRVAPASGGAPTARTHTWIVPALAVAMAAAGSYGVSRQGSPWLGFVFDAGCAFALLAYWRTQLRLPAARASEDIAEPLAVISAGLGVFLCLVSFGPVYVSNRHQLASGLTTVLLDLVPPMKAVREFDRFWIFGILFLTVYAVVQIGRAVAAQRLLVRGSAAGILLAAAGATLASRPLVASPAIEAPMDLVALARQSPGAGAIYVHPYMKWNSRSGVLMIAIARELKRPVVNGYLGIIPPWFGYATDVLHRYPDPEALWLLRKWNVETVVRIAAEAQLEQLTSPFQPADVGIEEIPAAIDLSHPSEPPPLASRTAERIDATWTRRDREGAGALAVKVPAGFRPEQIEIHFQPTPVAPVPASVEIYGIEAAQRVRLNEGQSGQWLKSLAADALVRRKLPVATIRLARPASGDLELECRGTADPPIDRIVLIGSSIS